MIIPLVNSQNLIFGFLVVHFSTPRSTSIDLTYPWVWFSVLTLSSWLGVSATLIGKSISVWFFAVGSFGSVFGSWFLGWLITNWTQVFTDWFPFEALHFNLWDLRFAQIPLVRAWLFLYFHLEIVTLIISAITLTEP